MIKIPEKIEIRKIPGADAGMQNIETILRRYFTIDNLTLSDADYVYRTFFGRSMSGKNKLEKFENAIADFLFTGSVSFDRWFSVLPPDSQRILYAVVFETVVMIGNLEKALNLKVNVKSEKWSSVKRLDPSYNLEFLAVHETRDIDGDSPAKRTVGISAVFRAAILPHLVPPPQALLENCVSAEAPEGAAYNNSADIPETVPLFCGALNKIFAEDDEKKSLGQGFLKKLINKMYASSGLAPFPLETEKAPAAYSPSSADLLGRFILLSTGLSGFAKPENPVELQRALFRNFLNLTAAADKKRTLYIYADNIEYNMFFGHITRHYSASRYFSLSEEEPGTITRRTLYECLLAIAKDGRTFDADALVNQLKYTGKDLSFLSKNELQNLRLKADTVYLDGAVIHKPYWTSLTPDGQLCFEFAEKPLFLGYFYLCASLGILEITQEPPPLICERGGKKIPVSVFNSLKTVKVTDFGRWCLGVSREPPKFEKNKYEAIADNELLLVTVRGKSLERTLFLDSIGEKLGPERWRVNSATFLSGCENKAQIEDRIRKFHALIESKPAPHWEALFKTVLDRAELFDKRSVDALVYKLPFTEPREREAVAELLADPELGGAAMRAEGGMLVVPRRNEKRFYALLASHGIAHFAGPKPP